MIMSSESSFFSDPKVIISIFALLISTVTLIWTLGNQSEQNRRWDKLNVANVILKEVKMTPCKKMTRAEVESTNWGYNALLYGSDYENQYTLPYKLVVRDLKHNLIPNVNPVYTINDLQKELVRIGYRGEANVAMVFKPIFVFDNKGRTDAKNLKIVIDSKFDSVEWREAYSSNAKLDLSIEQGIHISFEMEYPANIKIPDEILFKIKLAYDDIHGKPIKKEILTKWLSYVNDWSYSN